MKARATAVGLTLAAALAMPALAADTAGDFIKGMLGAGFVLFLCAALPIAFFVCLFMIVRRLGRIVVLLERLAAAQEHGKPGTEASRDRPA
jgi:hypothetical protein